MNRRKGRIIMKKIGLLLIMTLGLAGCTSQAQKSYDAAMDKGLAAIEASEYDKAKLAFEMALDEEVESKKQAQEYMEQIIALEVASHSFEEGDLEKAEAAIEPAITKDEAVARLVKDAEGVKKQIEKVKADEVSFKDMHREAVKLAKAKKYDEADKIWAQLNEKKKAMNNPYFVSFKKDFQAQRAANIKAKKEWVAQKKADAQKKKELAAQKKKEKQVANQTAQTPQVSANHSASTNTNAQASGGQSQPDVVTSASQKGREFGQRLSDPNLSVGERKAIVQEKKNYYRGRR